MIGHAIPDWRRSYGAPGLRGRIRVSNDDYQVTEILGFAPDGDGEHDFLWLEKSGANTIWVAERLARHAGIRTADVGFAGMKDRHALTRQWFSVRRPGGSKADWRKFDEAGVRLLKIERHSRKLRRGVHRGNRFRIVLRDTMGMGPDIDERLAIIRDRGVPNYFGEQRFGRNGNNLRLAEAVFSGRRLRRNQRSLALSAARAFLFNRVLERRVADANWDLLIPGDCANLDGTGSVFGVDVLDEELRRRVAQLDLHPSGPLWGRGPPMTGAAVATLELEVAASCRSLSDGLAEAGLEHARRALRLPVREFCWEGGFPALTLEFTLDRGAFATSVLRELAAYEDSASAPPD